MAVWRAEAMSSRIHEVDPSVGKDVEWIQVFAREGKTCWTRWPFMYKTVHGEEWTLWSVRVFVWCFFVKRSLEVPVSRQWTLRTRKMKAYSRFLGTDCLSFAKAWKNREKTKGEKQQSSNSSELPEASSSWPGVPWPERPLQSHGYWYSALVDSHTRHENIENVTMGEYTLLNIPFKEFQRSVLRPVETAWWMAAILSMAGKVTKWLLLLATCGSGHLSHGFSILIAISLSSSSHNQYRLTDCLAGCPMVSVCLTTSMVRPEAFLWDDGREGALLPFIFLWFSLSIFWRKIFPRLRSSREQDPHPVGCAAWLFGFVCALSSCDGETFFMGHGSTKHNRWESLVRTTLQWKESFLCSVVGVTPTNLDCQVCRCCQWHAATAGSPRTSNTLRSNHIDMINDEWFSHKCMLQRRSVGVAAWRTSPTSLVSTNSMYSSREYN